MSSGETKGRCSVKMCKAFLKTIGEKNNIIQKNVNHSHEIDIQKLQRQIVSASANRKATEDICERSAKILHRLATVQ